jgi:hypothetical protein
MELRINFSGYECFVMHRKYPQNNRHAIELIDTEDCCPVAVASVNIPEASLEDDEILIKGWSENEGIGKILIKAGIIGPVIGQVPTGFVHATKHKLLGI